jgi:hypothetical protein
MTQGNHGAIGLSPDKRKEENSARKELIMEIMFEGFTLGTITFVNRFVCPSIPPML